MMRIKGVLAALALVFAAACGSSDSTGPTGGNPSNGSMSAQVNGSQWSATIITPSINETISAIGGSNTTTTMAFAWSGAGTGTHQIGTSIGFNANLTINGDTWVANSGGGSGTLTILTRTANRITGTFSFTLVPSSGGASGNRTISQGAFDITF